MLMGISIQQRVAQQRQAIDNAIADFVRAAESNDSALLYRGVEGLHFSGPWNGWGRAFKQLSKTPLHPEFRSTFLSFWLRDGDSFRDAVGDDRVLCDALWMLLPAYTGGTVRLFRGESAWNRRNRTYGMSWTGERTVAEGFALGAWRTFEGGSVLLEAMVPAQSVICSPHLLGDQLQEREYLVDRRRLGKVRVIERYSQMGIDEHREWIERRNAAAALAADRSIL
jgi:hypothetical protein